MSALSHQVSNSSHTHSDVILFTYYHSKAFYVLLSWLGIWTVLCQSCLFAALVWSYGFRSQCSLDRCAVWIGCNVEPKGPGGTTNADVNGSCDNIYHENFQGNAHERPQVCQFFQLFSSLCLTLLSWHVMRVPIANKRDISAIHDQWLPLSWPL